MKSRSLDLGSQGTSWRGLDVTTGTVFFAAFLLLAIVTGSDEVVRNAWWYIAKVIEWVSFAFFLFVLGVLCLYLAVGDKWLSRVERQAVNRVKTAARLIAGFGFGAALASIDFLQGEPEYWLVVVFAGIWWAVWVFGEAIRRWLWSLRKVS